MSTNLSKFNEQLINFLNELSSLFPEDKMLKTSYHTVEFMKKSNPREIMNLFKKFVYPYKEQILKRDESFFLNNDFSDSIKSNSTITEMFRIKTLWASGRLTNNDKECVWNYFKVFIYLMDKEYS